nr:hypothetical protein [Anaerotruncus colihominis]
MFTISFRVTKRQVAAAAAVFVLSLVGGVWGRAAISELRGSPVRADSEVKVAKVAAKTEEQRVDFLESFGWQVEPDRKSTRLNSSHI